MEQESLPIANVARMQPYDFHDEKFVTWWLNSLYLFSPADQLAIAQLLRDAVHAPEAAREIEAFLTLRAPAIGDGSGQAEALCQPDATAGAGAATGILGPIATVWRTSPWTAALGVCAVGFFLAKALWVALREVLRVTV